MSVQGLHAARAAPCCTGAERAAPVLARRRSAQSCSSRCWCPAGAPLRARCTTSPLRTSARRCRKRTGGTPGDRREPLTTYTLTQPPPPSQALPATQGAELPPIMRGCPEDAAHCDPVHSAQQGLAHVLKSSRPAVLACLCHWLEPCQAHLLLVHDHESAHYEPCMHLWTAGNELKCLFNKHRKSHRRALSMPS